MPRYYLHPEFDPAQQLPQDPSRWANSFEGPHHSNIFDDTLKLLISSSPSASKMIYPISAVEIPRKLVISTWIAFLRRRYVNLLRLQKNPMKPSQTIRCNYLHNISEGTLNSYHDDLFDFIIGSNAAMVELTREIEEDALSLGISLSPMAAANNIYSMTDSGAHRPPQWEIDGWKSIRDLASAVGCITKAFETSYLQYITIQEARTSNRNAHSLSKITVLTMLFIPLSTIASILSMSGEFLPGNSLQWIFWAVSIPVLITLAFLYWREQLKHLLGRMRRNRSLLPLFEKKGA